MFQNKNNLNGIYISTGLGVVIFLFYLAIFVTVSLLSGHISMRIFKEDKIVQNQTCQILHSSFLNKQDTKIDRTHNEYNINLFNLFDKLTMNGSCRVNIRLIENTHIIRINLRNFKLSNIFLYDNTNFSILNRTGSRQFYLRKGIYKLVFNFNSENNHPTMVFEK